VCCGLESRIGRPRYPQQGLHVEDAADAARKAFRDWKAMECVILRSVISGQEEFFQRNQVISAGHSKARDKSRRKERQFKSSLFSDDF